MTRDQVEELIRRLSGAEAVEAAEVLGALGHEALCRALNTPEVLVVPGGRRALSAQLARQDAAAVTGALMRALAHKDWRPVQVAFDAIQAFGERMIPVLIENLEKEEEPAGRASTIMTLERMGASAAGNTLARAAHEDPVSEVRLAAVQALGRIGGDQAPAAAVAGLRDESQAVRLAAVRAAGWLRAREAVEGVIDFARAAATDARAAAVYALDRIGDTRATGFVTGLLKDPAPYVRWSAAVALRRLWTAKCEAALREAIGDADEVVATAALETLCIKRGRGSRQILLTLASEARPALRATAVCYISRG